MDSGVAIVISCCWILLFSEKPAYKHWPVSVQWTQISMWFIWNERYHLFSFAILYKKLKFVTNFTLDIDFRNRVAKYGRNCWWIFFIHCIHLARNIHAKRTKWWYKKKKKIQKNFMRIWRETENIYNIQSQAAHAYVCNSFKSHNTFIRNQYTRCTECDGDGNRETTNTHEFVRTLHVKA